MSGDERNAPPPYPQYPPYQQQPNQPNQPHQPHQPNQLPQPPSGAYPGYPVYPQYPYPYPYPAGAPNAAGYGPGQTSWAPNPQDARRYGRTGKVPWTLAQTVIGAALTLVPWLVLIVGVQVLSAAAGGSTTPTHRLPVSTDLLGGISALVVTVVGEGWFLIAPLVVALWRRPPGTTVRDGWHALGFRKAPLWRSVGWIVGGYLVVFVLGIIYSVLIQHFNLGLQTNEQTLLQTAQYAPITTICTLIGAVFVAPFCEEIFFRGYLFAGLLHGVNVWLAALIAAVLFTLAHGDIGSAVLLFAIGLILAAMRYRLGSIWPGMVLHALNNGLAAIIILATIFGGSLPAK